MALRHAFLKPAALALSLSLSLLPAAFAAKADASVQVARVELQLQHFEKARLAAEQATRTDAQDYRGHYYLAMAELGMGHADRARTAVDMALSLAPASARPGVEKLSGMVAAASSSNTEGGGGGDPIFISCKYSEIPKEGQPADDSRTEHTVIYKVQPQSFFLWNEQEAQWSPRACGITKTDARWTGNQSCEYNERKLGFRLHAQVVGADDHQYIDVAINRLTGAFSMAEKGSYGVNQPDKYQSLANWTYEHAYEGICRATRDPSAVAPKF